MKGNNDYWDQSKRQEPTKSDPIGHVCGNLGNKRKMTAKDSHLML